MPRARSFAALMSIERMRMQAMSVVPRCSRLRSKIGPMLSVTARSWLTKSGMPEKLTFFWEARSRRKSFSSVWLRGVMPLTLRFEVVGHEAEDRHVGWRTVEAGRFDAAAESPRMRVVDGDEPATAGAIADRHRRDDGRMGHAICGDADVGVALRRRAKTGVSEAVPLVVCLDARGAVVLPELDRHGVGRAAGAVAVVVGQRRGGVELVEP